MNELGVEIRSKFTLKDKVKTKLDKFSRTKQEFKEESDINNVIKKFKQTGMVTHVSAMKAQYGDFSDITSYKEAVDLVHESNDSFQALSSSIRKRFENDPEKLMEFIMNPENKEEAEKLGLLQKVETPVKNPDNNTTSQQEAGEGGKAE